MHVLRNVFNHSMAFLFIFLIVLMVRNVYFLWSPVDEFLISWLVFVSHLKYLPTPNSWRYSPVFSFKSFKGLDFMFKSLVHLKLIFVYAVRHRTKLFFPYSYPVMWILLLKKIFIFQWSWIFCQKAIVTYVWTNFCIFCSVPLICGLPIHQYPYCTWLL